MKQCLICIFLTIIFVFTYPVAVYSKKQSNHHIKNIHNNTISSENNPFKRVYKEEDFSTQSEQVIQNNEHQTFNSKKEDNYFLEQPKVQDKDLHTKLFVKQEENYLKNTIRAPIINVIMNAHQDINNGKNTTSTNKTKFTSSISASYLYSLTSKIRIGPEILHTTYNNTSHININDSLSLLIRGELSLYNNSYFDLFTFGGVGISFNTLNLVYTRLVITNTAKGEAFKEYIVKPIINGSSVPHKTAYFYCSTYPRFNNIDIDIIKDPKDPSKGYSEFTGNGFGICVYQNSDKTNITTINYEDFKTPETSISMPWFVGLGLDYKLSNILSNDPLDSNNKWSNYGISLGIRYFDNGSSNVSYKTMDNVDLYTIRYKGYLSVNVSLYLKI